MSTPAQTFILLGAIYLAPGMSPEVRGFCGLVCVAASVIFMVFA
jgi:hypothetical protein